MVGARVRRQQVAYAEGRGLSRRRACALLSVARSTIGYTSRLVARDAPVLTPMQTLAAQYPRYGYRTIRIFLERQGHMLGTDRMYRLWRQEGLQVRETATPPRGCSRPRPLPPTGINHVWVYDFVFDTCADGRMLKCLTIIDEFTRECLAIDVAGGIRSGRVIEVLTQLVSVHRAPRYLRSDNGPSRRPGDPPLAADGADRDRVHRSGQAVAERHGRIVQMESFGTSTCRCSGSATGSMRRSALRRGAGTTTRCGRIRVSAT